MNAVKLVLAAAVVLVAAQVTGWPLLDRLFYALVGLGLVGLALSWASLRGSRLTRRLVVERGQVGQSIRERLRLENRSRLPKLWVEVDDHSTLPGHLASLVTTLPAGGCHEWTVTTPLLQRGRFQLGPARLRGGDPFGLFPVQRTVRETAEVLVYPAVIALPNVALPSGDLPGDSRLHSRTPHITPNVAGIRDYAPGDSLNRIAWGPTARLGRLVVKEFELDPTADVWLVLDMDRGSHYTSAEYPVPSAQGGPYDALPVPQHSALGTRHTSPVESWRDSTEEFCVVVSASLAMHFLEQKRAVGLLASGQHHEVLPADRGARQVQKVLAALAVIGAEGSVGLGELLMAEAARFSRHSTLLIVTASTDERWVAALAVLLRGGLRAGVVAVDAGTFGGPASPLLLVGELASMRVPTFVLRRTDDVSLALADGTGAVGGRPQPGRGGRR